MKKVVLILLLLLVAGCALQMETPTGRVIMVHAEEKAAASTTTTTITPPATLPPAQTIEFADEPAPEQIIPLPELRTMVYTDSQDNLYVSFLDFIFVIPDVAELSPYAKDGIKYAGVILFPETKQGYGVCLPKTTGDQDWHVIVCDAHDRGERAALFEKYYTRTVDQWFEKLQEDVSWEDTQILKIRNNHLHVQSVSTKDYTMLVDTTYHVPVKVFEGATVLFSQPQIVFNTIPEEQEHAFRLLAQEITDEEIPGTEIAEVRMHPIDITQIEIFPASMVRSNQYAIKAIEFSIHNQYEDAAQGDIKILFNGPAWERIWKEPVVLPAQDTAHFFVLLDEYISLQDVLELEVQFDYKHEITGKTRLVIPADELAAHEGIPFIAKPRLS